MKQLLSYLIIPLSVLFTTCQNRGRCTEVLSKASLLSDSIPSLALVKLQEIKNVKRLDPEEQAEYNLIFIKSMLRADNKLPSDSIIQVTTKYYREQKDSINLHQSLYYNGVYHYRNAVYDSAKLYFNKAIDAIPPGNYNDRKSGYMRMIGYSFLYLGNTQAAVKTQIEGLQYARTAKDSLAVIHSLLGLADAYKYHKETEQSIDIYMQAIDRVKERGDRDLEATILNIVSEINESDNRVKEALYYKNKSQQIKRNRQDIPAVNLRRAILFDKQNMHDSARYYAQLSIKGDDQYVSDLAYAFLSKLDVKQGRYTDALNLLKNSEQAFNSFLSGIHLAELQKKYETEKLENENNLLKIKQKEHQFYLLISVFLLLFMLIVLYIIRIRNRRKNEKAAHENLMLRLQQDNLLLTQQNEISALREKEAVLRESLFKKISFFNKIPSLNKEENDQSDKQGKIKINNNDWQEMTIGIRDAYPEFLDKLKQHAPTLSDDDVRFCCLLKINVSMQDLSDIYCVSKSAITKRKYRLKTEKFQIVDKILNLDTVLQDLN
ncbi:MAG: hypothetical protein LLF81_11640 [Porphyromonadaceae bacterium]|nr:hypothetical protein [Porphyromonadaceae bacterium]